MKNNTISPDMMRDLALRAAQGEKDAFQELYIATRRQAYFVSLSITKNEADAQDILQESYLKAYQSLGQLENPALFQAWLHQIVANKAKNYINRKKPDSFAAYGDENAADWQEETDPSFLPDERLDREESKALIAKLVSGLPEDQRLVVLMHYYNDMEVADIAKSIEIPVGTVKSRLSRARQKLCAALEQAQRSGMKLYSALPIPFLAYFIKLLGFEESSADRLPPLILGPAAGGATAALAAKKTGLFSNIRRAAKKAADAFRAASAPVKIAAGAVAGVVVITGAVAGATAVYSNSKDIPQTKAPYTAAPMDIPAEIPLGYPLPATTEPYTAQPAGQTAMTGQTQAAADDGRKNVAVYAASTAAATAAATRAPVKFVLPSTEALTPFPTWPTRQPATTTAAATTAATTTATTTTTTTTAAPPKRTTTTAAEPTTEPAPPPVASFEFSEAGQMITKYTGTATEVAIPAAIDGKPVKHLGSNAFFGSKITRAEIPQGVDCIQSKTFGECAQLLELVVAPSVQYITGDAFKGCPEDLVIVCQEGSKAHTFAVANGMKFQLAAPVAAPAG